MRDPGTPRRNPFFDRASDSDSDNPGMGWRAETDEPQRPNQADEPDPMVDEAVGGFATLLALVEGLGDAQPEAAEHLVAAAHEIVLTVKVLVDATEAVLAQQRAAMAARNAMRVDADEPATPAADEPATPVAVVPFPVARRTEGS